MLGGQLAFIVLFLSPSGTSLGTRLRVVSGLSSSFSICLPLVAFFSSSSFPVYIWFGCRPRRLSMISMPGGGSLFRLLELFLLLRLRPRSVLPCRLGGGEDARPSRLPQGGVISSSSDNLFYPPPRLPSSYVYNLPDVPLNPCFHARNHSPFSRPLPNPSSFTSYNNPTFVIPPLPRYNSSSQIPPLHHAPSPGVPPPVPPNSSHFQSQAYPVFNVPRPSSQVDHQQPAYIQPQPAYIPPQSAYIHSQPAYDPVLPQTHSLYQHLPLPPSAISTIVSSSKALPTVTHIQILNSKSDFFLWDDGVQALIRANGLIGHILDPSAYVDPSRPDLAPTPLPVLSMSSTPPEIEASNRWWAEDNIVQHILLSRLGTTARGLLPSSSTATRTALSIYQILTKQYGTCNFADCTELLHSLHNSTCVAGRVPDFVSKWRVGLSKLQSAHFGYNIKICIALFVCGLPSVPAFNTLRADLPRRIAAIDRDDDYGAFVGLTDTVLELDTIFRPSAPLQPSRPPRPPPPSLSSPAPPVPTPSTLPSSDSASRTSQKGLSCGNCKSRGLRGTGHTDGTCFQPGGGMEGRREEYMANKVRVHAMFAEYLENAFTIPDEAQPPDIISSTPTSPIIPPLSDSDYFLPPIANLCVTSFPTNSDDRGDLYIQCDPKFPFHVAFTSTILQPTALLSMAGSYNALLDSGCTHHIIRDRSLFHDYCQSLFPLGLPTVALLMHWGAVMWNSVTLSVIDLLFSLFAIVSTLLRHLSTCCLLVHSSNGGCLAFSLLVESRKCFSPVIILSFLV